MKKTLNKVIVTLAAVAALAFGTSAMAATTVSNIDENGKATVTYETTAAAGEQVTVLLLKPTANTEGGITADEIAYIDQKAADTDGKVKFDMPISGVEAGQTYALMSGSESATAVTEDDAVFSTGDEAIHYGDVNDDNAIDAKDSTQVLLYTVGKGSIVGKADMLARGDVNIDEAVDAKDSTQILLYTVGKGSIINSHLDSWLTPATPAE